MKRWIAPLLLLLVLGIGGWLWGSPYVTVWEVKRAADSGRFGTISAHVDYSAVRESLKRQLRTRLSEGAPTGDVGRFGSILARQLSDPFVDAAVSPEGMRAIFASTAMARSDDPGTGDAAASTRHMRVRREAFDRFILTTGDPADGVFVFRLQGGLHWRLVEIRLPRDLSRIRL